MKYSNIIAFLGILLSTESAYAFCSAPSQPYSYSKPSKPTEPYKPYCINEYSGTHTCDEFTASQYNSAVSRYNQELQNYQTEREAYFQKLKDYVEDAKTYALCEINALD